MGSSITLTRKEYQEGLEKIAEVVAGDTSYLDQFSVTFPDGLNTAQTLEICRAIQNDSLESRVNLMKICIAGKKVKVTCPNGETESFCLSTASDSIEGFDLFKKEPLALIAIADCIYGHLLKKSLRLSKPTAAAAVETVTKQ